jgi:hypothetical protein
MVGDVNQMSSQGNAASQGRAIFISYRRDDSEGEAGRLFDDLVRAYGDDSVFMDVAGIQPGLDFRQAIDANVAGCGVLLAMIGPTWATIADSSGNRRLENPNDFVRLEIGLALGRKIPVIPVLVHDAKMPALELLPDDLKDLRYRNSVEITHARWNSDVALLVEALKGYVNVREGHETETVHATIPVQLPAPQAVAARGLEKKPRLPLFVGIGVAAVVVLGIVLFAVFHNGSSAPSPVVQGGAVVAASGSANSSTPAAGNASPLLGKWQALKSGGQDYPSQVEISNVGGEVVVEVMGNCPDQPNGLCTWGDRKAQLNGTSATTAKWTPRNTQWEKDHDRQVTLVIEPTASGMQTTVHNVWHDLNGAPRESFVPVQFMKIP